MWSYSTSSRYSYCKDYTVSLISGGSYAGTRTGTSTVCFLLLLLLLLVPALGYEYVSVRYGNSHTVQLPVRKGSRGASDK